MQVMGGWWDKFISQTPVPPPKSDSQPEPNKEEGEWSLAGLAGKFVLGFSSTRERDLTLIRALIPKSEGILQWIKTEVPPIAKLLAPGSEEMLEEVVLHILGNLVLKSLPEKHHKNAIAGKGIPAHLQMEPEAFFENCFLQIMESLGPKISSAHAQVTYSKSGVKKEMFLPLAQGMVDFLLPEGDGYRSWVSAASFIGVSLEDTIQELLLGSFSDKKEPPSTEKSAIQDALKQHVPFFLEKIENFYLTRDQEFLKKLTGTDDLFKLIQDSVPFISEFLELDEKLAPMGIKGELATRGMQMALTRGVFFLFQDVFKKEITEAPRLIPVDEVLEKVAAHFSFKVKDSFEKADPKDLKGWFNQSSYSYLQMFLPAQPGLAWIGDIIKREKEPLLKSLAELQLCLYKGTVQDESLEAYKGKLRTILVGAEPAVDEFYALCNGAVSFTLEKGIGILNNPILKKTDTIFVALNLLQEQVGLTLSPSLLHNLANGVEKILGTQNASLKWIGQQQGHILSSILFKLLVNCLAEKGPITKNIPPDQLFFHAFNSLLEIGVSDLPAADPAASEDSVTAGVSGAVEKWLNAFADDQKKLGSLIPLTSEMQESVEEKIRSKAPRFFAKAFMAVTRLIRSKRDIEASLNAHFPKKQKGEPCHLVQLFRLAPYAAVQGIPFTIRDKGHKILDGNVLDPATKNIIEGLFNELGNNQSQPLLRFYQFIGEFLETAGGQAVLFFSDQIKTLEGTGLDTIFELNGVEDTRKMDQFSDAEKQQLKTSSIPEYIVENVINKATSHFNGIRETKEEYQESKPSRQQFIEKFHQLGILHPALEEDQQATTTVRVKRNEHFENLALSIFNLFNINGIIESAIPDYAQKLCFELIKILAPMGLDAFYKNVSDADTINSTFISLLNKKADKDSVSIIDKLFPEEENDYKLGKKDLKPKFDNNFQKALQKNIGDALVAMIGMQKDWLPMQLVESESLRESAAEAIGQLIGEIFRDPVSGNPVSLLTILDNSLKGVLDNTAPAVWNETKGQFEYKDIGFDRKLQSANLKDTPRLFPKDDAEKAIKDAVEDRQKKRAEKNVFKYLKKIISDQTDQMMVEAFINKWEDFEISLHDSLVSSFGEEYGGITSDILIPTIRWMIKFPLTVGVLIFNYTVWFIVSQILTLIFNDQAKKRMKDVSMEIHDNAIYPVLDLVINRYSHHFAQVVSQIPVPASVTPIPVTPVASVPPIKVPVPSIKVTLDVD